MNTESKLIMELCKLKSSNRSYLLELFKTNLDFGYVLGQLLYHRVGGVAWHIIEKEGLGGHVRSELRNVLKSNYHANIEQTMSRRVIVDSLNTMLEFTDIKYAFLKGAWLCYEYPLGCRISNDIDILVDPKNISQLTELLCSDEYKQGYFKNGVFTEATRREIIESRMTRGETVPFVKYINFPGIEYSEVDVNFSLDYKNDENANVSRILNRSVVYNTGLHRVKTLDKYDFFLHLCAHLYKEATLLPWIKMGRDLQLYKFVDIYLQTFEWKENDCNDLLKRLDEFNMFKECYFSLTYVDALFGIDNPHICTLMEQLQTKFNNYDVINTVISPSNGKKYTYMQNNLAKRVLLPNRITYLKEVK